MSSTPSSSSSTATPAHDIIDAILSTKADKPDFDLNHFVKRIDELVAHYEAQLQKKRLFREKLGELPSATDASNFTDQVSTNVKLIANEIKAYSGNTHGASIRILNAIGSVHWVAVGFLMVGAVLQIADTIESNKKECLRLLKSMIGLSKVILRLLGLPSSQKELYGKLRESIQKIVEGAIRCCSQKKRKGLKRIWKASEDKHELQQLSIYMEAMSNDLLLEISTTILEGVESIGNKVSSLVSPPPCIPSPNHEAVGIEDKVKEVIEKLDWESNSATSAVVLYGVGGSGKTTLADAVYSSLKDKLHGWKHCKVTLIQNLEKNPKIKKIQSEILHALTTTNRHVSDYQSGQQSLKEIIEKESVFLYIDNALYLEPLVELLPKDFTSAKKFRLLLTARETHVKGTIEYCRIEHCKLYDIGSLSIDGALEVLCRKIDRKNPKETILQERPKVREIAEKCCCCPLFLEVIGGYIHQRKNTVESYERVLDWLNSGEEFGGSEKYNFDESRVLFSYEGLNSSSKEAFCDICSFFSWRWWKWEWEEVAYIVGEEEMECLQEGALIKRDGKKIKIHDLILSAGRNKSKQIRINREEDFSLIFKNKELASQVKGVWMENLGRLLFISAEELDAMSRLLRIFYMGSWARDLTVLKGKCSKQFDQLRFLHVENGMCRFPINIFKLSHLRYLSIHESTEDVTLSSSMNFPELKVLKLFCSRIHGIVEIGRLRSLKQLELYGCNADRISQCFPNLHNLQRLKLYQFIGELPEALVKLRHLQRLDLSCSNLKQLPAGFGGLTNLTELDLSHCNNLKQLPAGFGGLTNLIELNLSGCNNLEQLPAGFEGLTNLTQLTLSDCSSLQELPCDLEKLTSLESLSIRGCSSLLCLPHNLGRLMSAFGSHIYFDGCSSLSELPEDICNNTMVTSILLNRCSSLKRLPSRFGELTCLKLLQLTGCESLEELCNGFGGLEVLDLSVCKGLSSLPQNFGNFSSLETLNLSRCVKLEELSSDFHCLVALKHLNLSGCDSLCNLPDRFGELSCLESLNLSRCSSLENLPDGFGELSRLESLDLSRCSNLVKLSDGFGELSLLESLDLSGCSSLVELSDDFHLLRSLKRLQLCECENLGGEWMGRVGNMDGLWRLDIVCSERMIQCWMEMKRQKERRPVVVRDYFQGEEGSRAQLFEGVVARVFDEKGLLLDADENPFHPSSLQPQNPIIFIIDLNTDIRPPEALGKNLQQLQENSKELQIIYVGIRFKLLISSEFAALKFVAHTPDDFRTSSFCQKLSKLFDAARSIAVFRSTDKLEENNLNFLSAWEDMSSYMLDRAAFLGNTPRESNLELLKELLVPGETDYLLLSGNRQVKVADLQGKLILLLITHLDDVTIMRISALKEMYVKMQESGFTNNSVEVVWVPVVQSAHGSEKFERVAVNAPWPSVPKPWLMKERLESFSKAQGRNVPFVCVVDEKGRISNKDAMAMIERWGVEAYPFSEASDEELIKAEWETIKLNSSSTLQFVFQNIEFLSNKAKEVMDRGGVMTLLCVGEFREMIELGPHLNSALTTLGMEFNVLYLPSDIFSSDVYDKACEKLKENQSEMCGTATLSFSDIERFWRRIDNLRKDLMNVMGTDERIVKVRRMVLGLASAKNEEWASIVVVDINGEIVSGRGMEVVKVLSDGEEDSKENLLEDIKMRGFGESMESRWRDEIINAKHHPRHPLLQQWLSEDIGCNLCGEEVTYGYQCNVCEKYVICEECGRREVRYGIDSV